MCDHHTLPLHLKNKRARHIMKQKKGRLPSLLKYISKQEAIRKQFKLVWILPCFGCVARQGSCESTVLREEQEPSNVEGQPGE